MFNSEVKPVLATGKTKHVLHMQASEVQNSPSSFVYIVMYIVTWVSI